LARQQDLVEQQKPGVAVELLERRDPAVATKSTRAITRHEA
jgi:hypothetical protein